MSDQTKLPAYLQKYAAAEAPASSDTDSMASASVSVPRVSLKGKKFKLINGDEETKAANELFCVILAVEPEAGRFVKSYYINGYNPNDTAPPDCSSSDGLAPDSWVQSPQSERCNGCPKNAFGSAPSSDGTKKKGKACRDAKRLWIAKPDEIGETVYGLNVPVTSLKAMSEYGKSIRDMQIPLAAVITKLTMDDESEFPKLVFERAGFLAEEIGEEAIARSESREWINTNTHKQLAGPTDTARVQDKSKSKPASDDDKTLDGEAREVSASDVDGMAENW